MATRITVGMPVYNGTDHVAGALESLQEQTFQDFEVIISVDGNDQATADACRPFLSDERFRMVVHRERLDWFGNFNWLLQQPLGEFFCYRQHDDTTAPEFFEVLLRTADARTDAAAVYADCQWMGGRSDIEFAPSIEGKTLDRLPAAHRAEAPGRSSWADPSRCSTTGRTHQGRRVPRPFRDLRMARESATVGQLHKGSRTALLPPRSCG